jgi:hypothetical protein
VDHCVLRRELVVALAVRFDSVQLPRIADGAPGVLSMRHGFKVSRIAAGWITAEVVKF